MRFQLISTIEELTRLTPAWRQLLKDSGQPEPMQAPDWLLTWWRIYAPGSDRQLRVGVLYDGDRLVGLAPLVRRSFRYRRPGPVFRRLEWLGADVDEQDGVCSEYLGLITTPEHEIRVVDCFANRLLRGGFGAWDEVFLPALNGERTQTSLLADVFRQVDLSVDLRETTTAPYIKLPASWDAYLAQLGQSKRGTLRRQLRSFEDWAGGKAQLHVVTNAAVLEQAWAVLQELHQQRWQAEGQGGVFAAERFLRFHDLYARRLLERGELEMLWLSVADRPVAALYNFRVGGKVYFYQSGRAMDLPDKVRPGIAILAQAIQRAIGRGDREFDFLGGPSQYKQTFTATSRPLVELRVRRACLTSALQTALDGAIEVGRWVRSGLRFALAR